jgi:hypothetical protein
VTAPPLAPSSTKLERLIAIASALAAAGAWIVYARQDLVLSHYDAKAHLVVARRVIDSLTPGWQQIGAVWLPLPHLMNLLPTQIDLFYRTGAFASFVSMACFAITAVTAARIVVAVTGSGAGAVVSAALLVLNPNLIYLHVTPMTEPMSIAATFLAVLWLYECVVASRSAPPAPLRVPSKLKLVLFAAAWTRYEAWLILASAIAAAGYAQWRGGRTFRDAAQAIAKLAVWPATAIVVFLIHSRLTTGSWFVSGGFFELDEYYDGLAWRSVVAVWWGTHQLTGYVIETVALVTAAILVYRAGREPSAAPLLIPVALFTAALLPFYAFFEGHPYRVRYMVPLAAACAVLGGIAVGLVSRPEQRRHTPVLGPALAALLIGSSMVESPPWNTGAPMLTEAQWDAPRSVERRAVTKCLATGYRGERIFASMSSLAHYMQELSRDGFAIADFVHEGNGPLWFDGLERGAARQAGWLLAEEQSEGGDAVARQIRAHPAFARGMTRVCEGGGVALYRRSAD